MACTNASLNTSIHDFVWHNYTIRENILVSRSTCGGYYLLWILQWSYFWKLQNFRNGRKTKSASTTTSKQETTIVTNKFLNVLQASLYRKFCTNPDIIQVQDTTPAPKPCINWKSLRTVDSCLQKPRYKVIDCTIFGFLLELFQCIWQLLAPYVKGYTSSEAKCVKPDNLLTTRRTCRAFSDCNARVHFIEFHIFIRGNAK